MGRNGIKLELIEKESSRLLTYQKRKKSLLKKISEFSILCGVDAFLVIFGPKCKDHQLKLDAVFPSDSDEARKIVDKYKKPDGSKRTYTVCDYYSEKIKRLESDISKLRKEISAAKYSSWNRCLENLSEGELRLLCAQLDSKIDAADKRIDLCRQNRNNLMLLPVPESSLPVSFQNGESSGSNWLNLDCYSSGLQGFSGSNLRVLGGDLMERNAMEQQFEEGNMNSRGIWQNQDCVNSNLAWNWDCLRMDYNPGTCFVGSNSGLTLPPMMFPLFSLPYQVRPPQ